MADGVASAGEFADSHGSVGQAVLDFLQNVGRPIEAEMYLRLFRSFERGRFAVVAVSGEVLEDSVHGLADQLRWLLQLGLFPVVAVGFDRIVPHDELTSLREILAQADVPATLVQAAEHATLEQTLARSEVPIVTLEPVSHQVADELTALVLHLRPRKVVFLRSRGGIGPHGGAPVEIEPGHVLRTNRDGISALNVVRDVNLLLDSGLISDDDRHWLKLGEQILRELADVGARACTVSYAAPVSLLRELLTVKGEGTLLKLGSVIVEHPAQDGGARERVEPLLSESFGRKVRPEFFERSVELLLLEEHERGLAILERGVTGHFLSKFAVLPVARGEGLGQDLWWEIRKRTNCFYWRSRPANPINDWYRSVCDGMHRTERWRVFWCGIAATDIPAVIEDALLRPEDFE